MMCKLSKRHFNKLEAVQWFYVRVLIDAGYKKTIVLCKDILNRQMYYVLKTGRHVTLTGIMYKLRTTHAI